MESFSPVLAKRLKELREDKGLTLAALSKTLTKQYGIQISKESLTNYEVAEESCHSKAKKNEGMSVKYLRCLADFYGVSSDYLLGLTDIPTIKPDIQSACLTTGLSEEAVHSLIRCGHPKSGAWILQNGKEVYPYHGIDAVNFFLESPAFEDFAASIALVMVNSDDTLFNHSPVDVSQDEIDRVLDFLEFRGYSTLEREKIAEIELQSACNTLKTIFHNIFKKEAENNGQHQKGN